MTATVHTLDPLTLPLQGSQLIEASAGTGKTFTIALLYVRLVLGHGQTEPSLSEGLMPPNLLVVTFTEAATKELRERIRARLTEAAALFAADPDEPGDDSGDPLVRLRDSYPSSRWPDCRHKLLLAAEWMDEAAVSTIHGWCNRMLGEHAFDSGSLFRQTLETDQTALLEEVVRDYWRTFIYPLPEQLMAEVLDHWRGPDSLRQALKNLLAHVEALQPVEQEPAAATAAVQQQRQASRQALREPWPQWCEELELLLEEINNRKPKPLHGATRNSMLKALENLRAWAAGDTEVPDGLLGSRRSRGYDHLTAEGLAAAWKGEDAPPSHPAMAALSELEAALQALPSARPIILSHAARWVAARLESEKQRLASMGFDDLLKRLDQALGDSRGERLAETIRRQFPVAMIDEFQDTDPVQYRIFDRIYRVARNDPRTALLMIGDPKQAIYGFRGADIHTYLAARQAVSARTYTLGTNFRSAEAMVAGVNQMFSHGDRDRAEGAFGFRSGENNPLPFHPVRARGTERIWSIDGEPQAALTFWSLSDDRHLNKGSSRDMLSRACASEITRLLNLGRQQRAGFRHPGDPDQPLQPLRPEHIAVLVNKRQEADEVRQALGERGIRSVYLSDRNSVLQSPQATELLYWLQACAEPGQLSALRSALATPTLALSYLELDRLLRDENALDREIQRFQGYQALWQQQGVLPMLRRLLMDHRVPARLLAQPEGERALTDILHIAELLQQDSEQLEGEHALIHRYTDMLQSSDDEDEHRTMRLESDAGLVKVVTVHKSKGLEYPLVFLPYATDFRPEKAGQTFVKYHDGQGRLQVSLEPDRDSLALADRERLGEDIRKLYVALTRARYATWVGAAAIKGWRQSGLGHLIGQGASDQDTNLAPHLETMRAGLDCIAVTQVPPGSDEPYVGEPEPELGEALIPVRAARENWWIASYSAITYGPRSVEGREFPPASDDAEQEHLQDEAEMVDLPEAPPAGGAASTSNSGQHRFPRGSGPGTFLHELLEWCGSQGFGAVARDPAGLRELLERRCQIRNWEPWTATLEDWLQRLLTVPLPLPGTGSRFTLAGLEQVRPELEFWFESHGVATHRLDQLVSRQVLAGRARPRATPATFNGMLKGFIDLVFEHQGRYYVLDYKSNVLGEGDSAYNRGAMEDKILEKRYDLQYVIYLLALHRLLKARLPDYDYDTHMGGAIYLFLRGCDAPGGGAFTDRPDRSLIEALDKLFMGQAEELA